MDGISTDLFEKKITDLGFLKLLKTPLDGGLLNAWPNVDDAVREANLLRDKIRTLMTMRDKEIEQISKRYEDIITKLQNVKDAVDSTIETFCNVHDKDLEFIPSGEHEKKATKKLQNCTLTIIKKSETRIKVQSDKP